MLCNTFLVSERLQNIFFLNHPLVFLLSLEKILRPLLSILCANVHNPNLEITCFFFSFFFWLSSYTSCSHIVQKHHEKYLMSKEKHVNKKNSLKFSIRIFLEVFNLFCVAHSGQFSKSQHNEYMKDMTSELLDVSGGEITDYTCDSELIFCLSGCQSFTGMSWNGLGSCAVGYLTMIVLLEFHFNSCGHSFFTSVEKLRTPFKRKLGSWMLYQVIPLCFRGGSTWYLKNTVGTCIIEGKECFEV